MGQKGSRERLHAIQVNVTEINNIVHTKKLSANDRDKFEEILQNYSQEINFILSKSLRPSKLSRVQRLIQLALQELDGLNARSTLRRIDSDINYLTRLHTKEKSIQDLDKITKSLEVLNRDLNLENFKKGKEVFDNLKSRVDSIEEVSEEVSVRKSEVFTMVSSVQNLILELEMEDKLKQAEDRHNRNKIDLRRFMGVFESKCYKNHKKFLTELRDEVSRVLEVSEKIVERKKYLLFNINNNMVAMDLKARENEERILKQIEGEIVASSSTTNQSLVDNLVECYKTFESGFSAKCSVSELKEIFRLLSDVRLRIDQKLKVLEVQIQDGECCVKKVELLEDKPLDNGLERLRKDLESVRKEIETRTYSKESLEYRNILKKIQDFRAEIKNFQNSKFQDNILKCVDDVLVLLENKTSKRNSTSGDMLIDIISANTSVNELGEKIRQNNFHDFSSIEKNLNEHLDYLKSLKISPGKSSIHEFRDYVVIQIESHLSNLRKLKINENVQNNKNKQFLI